jgi:hypothetical protein
VDVCLIALELDLVKCRLFFLCKKKFLLAFSIGCLAASSEKKGFLVLFLLPPFFFADFVL